MARSARPSFSAVMQAAVRDGTFPVNVAVSATVKSYNRTRQTVEVEAMVQPSRDLLDGSREFVPFPVVRNVPVLWPASGVASLTWDLETGDEVLLIVRDRSHAEVRAGAALPTKPASGRRWSLIDAVAIPGLATRALDSSAVGANPTLAMRAGKGLRVGASTASKALALAEKVDAELTKIATAHNSHTHTIPSGSSGTPSVSYTRAGTSSTRIFTDDT